MENSEVGATDAVASHSAAAHRFLRVSLGQLTPSLVFWSVRHRDQLQVNPDLGPGRRLEPRHCLQVVDTLTDHWWSRPAEVFCKTQRATWQQRSGATVVAAITTRVKKTNTLTYNRISRTPTVVSCAPQFPSQSSSGFTGSCFIGVALLPSSGYS